MTENHKCRLREWASGEIERCGNETKRTRRMSKVVSFVRRLFTTQRDPENPRLCVKCGHNFRIAPRKMRYANDREYGERLLYECPRCGFKWTGPTLE